MNVTRALVALLSVGGVATSHAQSPPAAAKPPRIEDNSFLIEEAYNQEKGVVQHISVFQRDLTTRAWSYFFTQEWPVRGQRHQFSYTAAVARLGTSATGFFKFPATAEGATRLCQVGSFHRAAIPAVGR